jgi:hypothetical protein
MQYTIFGSFVEWNMKIIVNLQYQLFLFRYNIFKLLKELEL